MCGRFSATTPGDIAEEFGLARLPLDFGPRYNIAPGQHALVILGPWEARRAELFRWGLVPAWAGDVAVGYRMINARCETLAEKPAFRTPFRRRRCLVVADGFFEWRTAGRAKIPIRFTLRSGRPFALAGLWDIWAPEGRAPVHSFTIITTSANGLVSEVHDRMPVILPKESWDLWLDPNMQELLGLQPLLVPFPAEEMEAYEVSPIVNSAKNNSPECVQRAG